MRYAHSEWVGVGQVAAGMPWLDTPGEQYRDHQYKMGGRLKFETRPSVLTQACAVATNMKDKARRVLIVVNPA